MVRNEPDLERQRIFKAHSLTLLQVARKGPRILLFPTTGWIEHGCGLRVRRQPAKGGWRLIRTSSLRLTVARLPTCELGQACKAPLLDFPLRLAHQRPHLALKSIDEARYAVASKRRKQELVDTQVAESTEILSELRGRGQHSLDVPAGLGPALGESDVDAMAQMEGIEASLP